MPRPQTKEDLLTASTACYEKLNALIDSLSTKEQGETFSYGKGFNRTEAHWGRDKNIRDILAHLHAWQRMLINFVEANEGKNMTHASNAPRPVVPFLPSPHTWKTTPALNAEIWEHYQAQSLAHVRSMLDESHHHVLAIISRYDDEELFTKAHFSWTGTTSLGSYCVSATSSHYEWAMKKIRTWLRNRPQTV